MAIDKGIVANILGASTKAIGDRAYGNILLGIPGGKEQVATAIEYLGAIKDITVEEV